MTTLTEKILEIAALADQQRGWETFRLLIEELENKPCSEKELKKITTLLYHPDAAIRRETALFLDTQGITVKDTDYHQYLFAMQDMDLLVPMMHENARVRDMLFNGLKDGNARLRTRLLRFINEQDCRTNEERVLFHFGCGAYDLLLEDYHKAGDAPELKKGILDLLHTGTRTCYSDYNRRQCAILLEQIAGMETLDEEIRALLRPSPKKVSAEPLPQESKPVGTWDDLDLLIDKIQKNGLHLKNGIVFPEIRKSAVSGRITYRNPSLQTWPAEKRKEEICPPQGSVLLRYDYISMEPLILLNILLQEQLLSLADIPETDLYQAIAPEDRDAGKRYLNTIINGNVSLPGFKPAPFLWKFIEAMEALRDDLRDRFYSADGIRNIAGKPVEMEREVANFDGKLMNRLVRGSASELFNRALVELDRWFVSHNHNAEIYFVLFDEIWVRVHHTRRDVEEEIGRILNEQWKHYDFFVPLSVRTNHDHEYQKNEGRM